MTNNDKFHHHVATTTAAVSSFHRLLLVVSSSLLLLLALLPQSNAFLTPPQSFRNPSLHHRHQLPSTSSFQTSLSSKSYRDYSSRSVVVQFWTRSQDPPLSSLVDVSTDYTLAPTKEDYLHLHENQRLVCIGDVHGDLHALQDFLELAQVYDRSTDSWIGGNAILVQCGDVLDRFTQELACYSLLAKLSHQAIAQDGRVVVLAGNHEILNAMGLFQYAVHDQEYETKIGTQVDKQLQTPEWRRQYVGNQPARWASYEPGGLLAASLMANMKVAIQVGNTVCVHAGLRPSHLLENGGISGMNKEFRDWITLTNTSGWSGDNPVSYNNSGRYASPNLARMDAEKRQTYYINSVPKFLAGGVGATGPIWMRDYSSPHDQNPKDPDAAQAMIDETLNMLNAERMVMGHTIQRHINCALNGKAWRVDVGASRGCINGSPEVLEIARVCTTAQYYGKGSCEERISILTKDGRVPADQRAVTSMISAL